MLGKGEQMKKSVIVSNAYENHDNPAAELVQCACTFDCKVEIEHDSVVVNAKSIMGLMAFNPVEGMTVNIITTGVDEEQAINAIEEFLCK